MAKKKVEGYYIDGKANGPFEVFDSLGNLKFAYTSIDNVKNGPFTEYYPNGSILSHGTYKNGNPDGWYYVYHENGKVHKKALFENGKEFYLKAFTKDSVLYKNTLPIEVKANTSEIFLHDTVVFSIELLYTELEEKEGVIIFLGSLDEKKQLIDTLDTWGDEGLVTRYEKVVDKEGGHILSGVLVEVVLVSDSLQKVVGRYPFEYKYEVLPKHTLD